MRLTAQQFRDMINRGVIKQQGKHLVSGDLSPDFLSTLDKVDGLFIPGEVYSSKNSKRIFPKVGPGGAGGWKFKGKAARPFITDSAAATKYKKESLPFYLGMKESFLEMVDGVSHPFVIEFTFYRTTKRKFDFNNMTQAVQDMMVKAGWIEDDDIAHLLPVPPLPPKQAYFIDKKQPGVLINIIK